MAGLEVLNKINKELETTSDIIGIQEVEKERVFFLFLDKCLNRRSVMIVIKSSSPGLRRAGS